MAEKNIDFLNLAVYLRREKISEKKIYYSSFPGIGLNEAQHYSLRALEQNFNFFCITDENGDYFVRLKALVEETYVLNNQQSVILIAHSMGGPMTLLFLQAQTQEWKNKYIKSMVTLAGVWGGSVKALKVFAIGDDLGAFMLRQSVLRAEQITSPSLAWLLPSKLFWKETEVLVQTNSRNYTIADYKDFFE